MGHIYCFHTKDPIVHLSAVLFHLLHQGCRQYEAGCLGLKLQTHSPFLTLHS